MRYHRLIPWSFFASFEQFWYDVASRLEDQYDSLQEIAARLDVLEYLVGVVYKTVRK
jgi:hypothetical protein